MEKDTGHIVVKIKYHPGAEYESSKKAYIK